MTWLLKILLRAFQEMDQKHLLMMLTCDVLFENPVENLVKLYRQLLNGSHVPEVFIVQKLQEHSMLPKKINTEAWCMQYNNLQFFQLLRMEKKTMEKLVMIVARVDATKVLSKKYTGGHHPIDIRSQVLIFIWYMATQDTLLSIGTRFKISPTTVMDIVNKLLYFLLKLKKTYIKFPQNEDELLTVSRQFHKYPGVVGALDGTHIFIKVEKEQQDSYIDRYRRHSINCMAICDANKLFTSVFVGFPGSAHDSRVFESFMLFQDIERYGPNHVFLDVSKYHLIGDSAFGLKTWLMTPFKGNQLTRRERKHNYCLSSERVVIEHAFGTLKGRWRRLQFINTYNICKTVEIATAACVLHNFCILNSDPWTGECIYDRRIMREEAADDQREAQLKRNLIADYLFNQ